MAIILKLLPPASPSSIQSLELEKPHCKLFLPHCLIFRVTSLPVFPLSDKIQLFLNLLDKVSKSISLKIHFKNDSIRKVCENKKEAVKKYGMGCAKSLYARIMDITATDCLSELRAGRPHSLKGKRKGQISVKLDKKNRLIFTAHNQQTSDHKMDWKKVDEVLFIEITNYHD